MADGKKYLNRTGFKSGSGILASYPLFRGRSGADNLKAWRGQEMLETLAGGILGAGASKFIPEVHGGKGPIPADPPETFPAEDTWDKSFRDEGLTIPDEEKIKVPDSIPPQIKVETTGFPDLSEELNKPVITYSKDFPKNAKDLIERSVGSEKGNKAIEKIYDDSIFDDILESSELDNIRRLEEAYTGGLADTGDAAVPLIFENSLLDQHEDYMDDYKDTLADAARETLGSEFKVYRLMEKEDALKMLIDGEFPNIKRLQEDEEGDESYQDVIINMMGEETPMSREFFSFSLSPKEALSFRFLSAGGRGDKKDEDFVLIEKKTSPTDIVMRGHESERDFVLRMDGDSVGSSYVTPNIFNVYDIKFDDKNKVELSENELFKNFVEKSKLERVKEEDPTSNLYKTLNKAQHAFLMDSISEYTENISKGTMDKVNKLLYLDEKVTFTDNQLKELNDATADKRQSDYDSANKKNWDDVDEDLDLSIKENAKTLGTITEGEYIDLWQKLKKPKKIIKKAHGGLIDKPLTGRSRYI